MMLAYHDPAKQFSCYSKNGTFTRIHSHSNTVRHFSSGTGERIERKKKKRKPLVKKDCKHVHQGHTS